MVFELDRRVGLCRSCRTIEILLRLQLVLGLRQLIHYSPIRPKRPPKPTPCVFCAQKITTARPAATGAPSSGLVFLSVATDTPVLLALELVVKQEQCLLVRLGCANDGEHSLAGIIMGLLGNGYLRTRQTSNLGDLGPATTDDAANHVGGDGDVLGAEVGGLSGGRTRRSTAFPRRVTIRASGGCHS